MFKGFRDFLMRGNIVDLAVAFVIGVAFAAVVEAFSKDFIGSILAKIGGSPNFNSVSIGGILIGTTITALISFLITSAAVYFAVVVPMNKLMSLRRRREEEVAVATPEDIALLTEIRDLLAQRQGQV